MNKHALPRSEVEKYALLFQQYLKAKGFQDKVEIGIYKTDTQGSIFDNVDPEDWSYDDYTLTIPGNSELLYQITGEFVASLNDPKLRYNLFQSSLILQK